MSNMNQKSSRLCVKGLPKYLKEGRLRDIFSEQGEVTDVKILRTPDGRSRQMGFIGYKSAEVASRAQKHFDRSFIDTAKLQVSIALPFGDKSLNSKAWSKYTKAKLARAKETEEDAKAAKEPEEKLKTEPKKSGDKKLEEFLAVSQARSKAQFWANDDIVGGDGKEEESQSIPKPKQSNDSEDSDSDSSSSSDSEVENDMVNSGKTSETTATNQLAKNSKVSDKDYLKSLMKSGDEDSDSESDDSDSSDSSSSSSESSDEEMEEEQKEDKPKPSKRNDSRKEYDIAEEDVAESGRLFVRNLPFSTSEEELKELFSSYGPVSEVHIPLDHSKRSRGIGYVLFMIPEDAVRAMTNVDGVIFQGRLLHVLPAMSKKDDRSKEDSNNSEKAEGYKAKLEAKRKEQANDDTNWSSLFTRADAAAGAVAKQLGLSKGELLDDSLDVQESLAVRVALSETQVIAESKKFLKDQGVDLDALQLALEKGAKIERSSTVIFAKNLPEDAQETDLRQMFGKFGALERLVMPPSRTMALVVFYEPKVAKKAFQSMAYKRYKRAPLYLEWAPKGIITGSAAKPANGEGEDGPETKTEQSVEPNMVTQDNMVFMKNLSFEVTEEKLSGFIEKLCGKGKISHITIPRKKRTKRDGTVEELIMGYGFIETVSADAARQVVRTCDGKEMDGRVIEVKLSVRPKAKVPMAQASPTENSSTAITTESAGSQGVTKLVVRNLPFEATKKELRRLFSAYGQVNSVRVPKKFDGTHRGFAFVDFVTHQEAKAAFSSLASTHLYGRHLVLEWAQDENSLETLRRKAAADLDTSESAKARESKRMRLDEDDLSDGGDESE